jgi:hypothetical protein
MGKKRRNSHYGLSGDLSALQFFQVPSGWMLSSSGVIFGGMAFQVLTLSFWKKPKIYLRNELPFNERKVSFPYLVTYILYD